MISWNRRSSSSLLLAAVLFFCTALPALGAGVTCGASDAISGGVHKRCVDSGTGKGVFHVWTPSSFDATKPGYTVFYLHGYSDQCGAPSTNEGETDDGVPNTFAPPAQVYVDGVWQSHGLAAQFAASGLNAVFVVSQTATCDSGIPPASPGHVDNNVHWDNFSDMKADLISAGYTLPSGPIVLIGHSGAYRQINAWENDDAGITHVIHLDTLYADLSNFTSWLNASGHTSTIVATPGETKSRADGVVANVKDAVKITSLPSGLSSMPDNAKKARVLYIPESSVLHMELVTSGSVIPMLLQRVASAGTASGAPPGGQPPTPPPAGSSGTASTAPTQAVLQPDTPKLEIPIPNVSFTNGANVAGNLSLPWIGQYIGGVYTFMIGIVGLVAAVMMIIGGFQYLTSAGDKGKIAAGKKRITDALIGMVLAFGSYILLYTINPLLVQFQGLQLVGVKTIPFDGGAHDQATVVTGPDVGATPSALSGKVPYFAQWDKKWQVDNGCGTTNVWNSGCGPTSLAMVMNSYGAATDPLTLEKETRDGGFKSCNGGMNRGAILTSGIVGKHNFVGDAIDPGKKAAILQLLQQGKPLIAGMGGNSIFTFSGHYIVLTGVDAQGNISVNDPGRNPSAPYTNVYLGAKYGGNTFGTMTGCAKTVQSGAFLECLGPDINPPINQASVPPDYVFAHLSHITYVHPAGTATLDPSIYARLASEWSAQTALACIGS